MSARRFVEHYVLLRHLDRILVHAIINQLIFLFLLVLLFRLFLLILRMLLFRRCLNRYGLATLFE